MGAAKDMQALSDYSRFQPVPADEPVAVANANNISGEKEESYRPAFADIRQGLKILLPEIAIRENPLDELKTVLPVFLEGYTLIAESRYRSKINDYILEQCHTHFSFEITEDEINDLW